MQKINPKYHLTNTTEKLKTIYEDRPIIYCELGCNTGVNAYTVLKTLNVSKAYLIDLYDQYRTHENKMSNKLNYDKNYNECVERLEEFSDKIQIIKGDINKISHTIPDGIDYIFYECDQIYQGVMLTLKQYFRKLKKGGYMSGRSFRTTNKEEVHAVLDFIFSNRKGVEFSVFNREWLIRKMV